MSSMVRVCYQDATRDQCSTWQRIAFRYMNTLHRCVPVIVVWVLSLVFSRAPWRVKTKCVHDQWRDVSDSGSGDRVLQRPDLCSFHSLVVYGMLGMRING